MAKDKRKPRNYFEGVTADAVAPIYDSLEPQEKPRNYFEGLDQEVPDAPDLPMPKAEEEVPSKDLDFIDYERQFLSRTIGEFGKTLTSTPMQYFGTVEAEGRRRQYVVAKKILASNPSPERLKRLNEYRTEYESFGGIEKYVEEYESRNGHLSNPLLTAGKYVEKTIDRTLPSDKRLQGSFWFDTIPSGAGQIGGFMTAGLATGGAALQAGLTKAAIPAVQTAGSMAMGAIQNGYSYYKDAIAEGATPEMAFNGLIRGSFMGMTEGAPFGPFFHRVNQLSGGKIAKVLHETYKRSGIKVSEKGKFVLEVLGGAATEAGQEMLVQLDQNDFIKTYVNQNRKYFDGLAESGAAGGVLGGMMALVYAGMGLKLPKRNRQEADPAERDRARRQIEERILKAYEEEKKKSAKATRDLEAWRLAYNKQRLEERKSVAFKMVDAQEEIDDYMRGQMKEALEELQPRVLMLPPPEPTQPRGFQPLQEPGDGTVIEMGPPTPPARPAVAEKDVLPYDPFGTDLYEDNENEQYNDYLDEIADGFYSYREDLLDQMDEEEGDAEVDAEVDAEIELEETVEDDWLDQLLESEDIALNLLDDAKPENQMPEGSLEILLSNFPDNKLPAVGATGEIKDASPTPLQFDERSPDEIDFWNHLMVKIDPRHRNIPMAEKRFFFDYAKFLYALINRDNPNSRYKFESTYTEDQIDEFEDLALAQLYAFTEIATVLSRDEYIGIFDEKVERRFNEQLEFLTEVLTSMTGALTPTADINYDEESKSQFRHINEYLKDVVKLVNEGNEFESEMILDALDVDKRGFSYDESMGADPRIFKTYEQIINRMLNARLSKEIIIGTMMVDKLGLRDGHMKSFMTLMGFPTNPNVFHPIIISRVKKALAENNEPNMAHDEDGLPVRPIDDEGNVAVSINPVLLSRVMSDVYAELTDLNTDNGVKEENLTDAEKELLGSRIEYLEQYALISLNYAQDISPEQFAKELQKYSGDFPYGTTPGAFVLNNTHKANIIYSLPNFKGTLKGYSGNENAGLPLLYLHSYDGNGSRIRGMAEGQEKNRLPIITVNVPKAALSKPFGVYDQDYLKEREGETFPLVAYEPDDVGEAIIYMSEEEAKANAEMYNKYAGEVGLKTHYGVARAAGARNSEIFYDPENADKFVVQVEIEGTNGSVQKYYLGDPNQVDVQTGHGTQIRRSKDLYNKANMASLAFVDLLSFDGVESTKRKGLFTPAALKAIKDRLNQAGLSDLLTAEGVDFDEDLSLRKNLEEAGLERELNVITFIKQLQDLMVRRPEFYDQYVGKSLRDIKAQQELQGDLTAQQIERNIEEAQTRIEEELMVQAYIAYLNNFEEVNRVDKFVADLTGSRVKNIQGDTQRKLFNATRARQYTNRFVRNLFTAAKRETIARRGAAQSEWAEREVISKEQLGSFRSINERIRQNNISLSIAGRDMDEAGREQDKMLARLEADGFDQEEAIKFIDDSGFAAINLPDKFQEYLNKYTEAEKVSFENIVEAYAQAETQFEDVWLPEAKSLRKEKEDLVAGLPEKTVELIEELDEQLSEKDEAIRLQVEEIEDYTEELQEPDGSLLPAYQDRLDDYNSILNKLRNDKAELEKQLADATGASESLLDFLEREGANNYIPFTYYVVKFKVGNQTFEMSMSDERAVKSLQGDNDAMDIGGIVESVEKKTLGIMWNPETETAFYGNTPEKVFLNPDISLAAIIAAAKSKSNVDLGSALNYKNTAKGRMKLLEKFTGALDVKNNPEAAQKLVDWMNESADLTTFLGPQHRVTAQIGSQLFTPQRVADQNPFAPAQPSAVSEDLAYAKLYQYNMESAGTRSVTPFTDKTSGRQNSYLMSVENGGSIPDIMDADSLTEPVLFPALVRFMLDGETDVTSEMTDKQIASAMQGHRTSMNRDPSASRASSNKILTMPNGLDASEIIPNAMIHGGQAKAIDIWSQVSDLARNSAYDTGINTSIEDLVFQHQALTERSHNRLDINNPINAEVAALYNPQALSSNIIENGQIDIYGTKMPESVKALTKNPNESILVFMKPLEHSSAAQPQNYPDALTPGKKENLELALARGQKINSAGHLYIRLTKDGKHWEVGLNPTLADSALQIAHSPHEGRHRSIVFEEMGKQVVPVHMAASYMPRDYFESDEAYEAQQRLFDGFVPDRYAKPEPGDDKVAGGKYGEDSWHNVLVPWDRIASAVEKYGEIVFPRVLIQESQANRPGEEAYASLKNLDELPESRRANKTNMMATTLRGRRRQAMPINPADLVDKFKQELRRPERKRPTFNPKYLFTYREVSDVGAAKRFDEAPIQLLPTQQGEYRLGDKIKIRKTTPEDIPTEDKAALQGRRDTIADMYASIDLYKVVVERPDSPEAKAFLEQAGDVEHIAQALSVIYGIEVGQKTYEGLIEGIENWIEKESKFINKILNQYPAGHIVVRERRMPDGSIEETYFADPTSEEAKDLPDSDDIDYYADLANEIVGDLAAGMSNGSITSDDIKKIFTTGLKPKDEVFEIIDAVHKALPSAKYDFRADFPSPVIDEIKARIAQIVQSKLPDQVELMKLENLKPKKKRVGLWTNNPDHQGLNRDYKEKKTKATKIPKARIVSINADEYVVLPADDTIVEIIERGDFSTDSVPKQPRQKQELLVHGSTMDNLKGIAEAGKFSLGEGKRFWGFTNLGSMSIYLSISSSETAENWINSGLGYEGFVEAVLKEGKSMFKVRTREDLETVARLATDGKLDWNSFHRLEFISNHNLLPLIDRLSFFESQGLTREEANERVLLEEDKEYLFNRSVPNEIQLQLGESVMTLKLKDEELLAMARQSMEITRGWESRLAFFNIHALDINVPEEALYEADPYAVGGMRMIPLSGVVPSVIVFNPDDIDVIAVKDMSGVDINQRPPTPLEVEQNEMVLTEDVVEYVEEAEDNAIDPDINHDVLVSQSKAELEQAEMDLKPVEVDKIDEEIAYLQEIVEEENGKLNDAMTKFKPAFVKLQNDGFDYFDQRALLMGESAETQEVNDKWNESSYTAKELFEWEKMMEAIVYHEGRVEDLAGKVANLRARKGELSGQTIERPDVDLSDFVDEIVTPEYKNDVQQLMEGGYPLEVIEDLISRFGEREEEILLGMKPETDEEKMLYQAAVRYNAEFSAEEKDAFYNNYVTELEVTGTSTVSDPAAAPVQQAPEQATTDEHDADVEMLASMGYPEELASEMIVMFGEGEHEEYLRNNPQTDKMYQAIERFEQEFSVEEREALYANYLDSVAELNLEDPSPAADSSQPTDEATMVEDLRANAREMMDEIDALKESGDESEETIQEIESLEQDLDEVMQLLQRYQDLGMISPTEELVPEDTIEEEEEEEDFDEDEGEAELLTFDEGYDDPLDMSDAELRAELIDLSELDARIGLDKDLRLRKKEIAREMQTRIYPFGEGLKSPAERIASILDGDNSIAMDKTSTYQKRVRGKYKSATRTAALPQPQSSFPNFAAFIQEKVAAGKASLLELLDTVDERFNPMIGHAVRMFAFSGYTGRDLLRMLNTMNPQRLASLATESALVKEMGRLLEGTPDEVQGKVYDVLIGKSDGSDLDPQLAVTVRGVRAYIDQLSLQIRDLVLENRKQSEDSDPSADPTTEEDEEVFSHIQQVITDNIGTYVTRFYKADYISGYSYLVKSTRPDLINDAIQGLMKDHKNMTEEQAVAMVDQLLRRHGQKYSATSFLGPNVGRARLLKRKTLPEYIRRLLGEEKNPGLVVDKTVHDLQAMIINFEIMTQVKNFTKPDGSVYAVDEYDQVNGFIQQVPKELRYGPLAGMYVTSETYDALVDFEQGFNNFVLDVINDYVGAPYRKMQTAGNPATHARNIGGGAFLSFLANTSITNPRNWQYYERAVFALKNRNSSDFGEVASSGALGTQQNISPQLENMINDIERSVRDGMSWASAYRKYMREATKSVREGWEAIQELYIAEDQFFRAATYFKELAHGASPVEAANWCNMMYPTYGNNPRVQRNLEKTGFLAAFQSFFLSTIPIMANAAIHNPIKLALLQGATFAATSGIISMAATAITDALLGDDEDDEVGALERYGEWVYNWNLARGLLPDYAKQSVPAPMGGKLYVINIQNIQPLSDTLESLSRYSVNPVKEAQEQFLFQTPGSELMIKIATGRDSRGYPAYMTPFGARGERPITPNNPTAQETMSMIATHLSETQTPPWMVGAEQRRFAEFFKKGQEEGDWRDLAATAVGFVTGIRPVEVEWDRLYKYKLSAENRDFVSRLMNHDKKIDGSIKDLKETLVVLDLDITRHSDRIAQLDKEYKAAKSIGGTMGLEWKARAEVDRQKKAVLSRGKNLRIKFMQKINYLNKKAANQGE